jgi:heme/copper-type cytochrome/quinol oxidase subunit 1
MNPLIITFVAVIIFVIVIYYNLINSEELKEDAVDKNIEEAIDVNQYVSEKMNELPNETTVIELYQKPKRKYYKKKTNVTKKPIVTKNFKIAEQPIKKSKPVK